MKICLSPGCGKEAKLQCPTCLKLGIEDSYFCSQDCFKENWNDHKSVHKKVKEALNEAVDNENYNPWPGYSFTGKLRPFPVTPMRTVPAHILRPDYADDINGISQSERSLKDSTSIETLSEEMQEKMRVSCRLGREVLDETFKAVAIGVTTEELDRIAHEACVERECYPSPLNYYKFPKSCCTSINEVICHGIPDQRPLQDGDIVNIDITVFHDGYHGDLNETFFVGNVSDKAKELVQTSYECLEKAILACKPGVRYREMGDIIQKHAQSHGFSVVKTYCGHGINRLFHTSPSVPHYAKNKAVGIMKPGHTFTIEPMISQGQWRDKTWPDDWTSVTSDGKLSAQFEHTLLITDTGVEVLTKNLDGIPHFMKQPQYSKKL